MRTARPLAESLAAAAAIRDVALDWLGEVGSVALFVSTGREPGTGPLLDALHSRGVRVLLPVVRAGRVLDWAEYAGPDALAPATYGLLEPIGPLLGEAAVATVDVLLAPGLAVSRDGVRLGQGGGFYDRVLGLLPATTRRAVVLHDDEVGLDVPAEPHDQRVPLALTPSGLVPLTAG
jgi:5-formyltetrahydrofolate cyclo-ligase